jgi:heptosyltransferase-2
VKESYGFDNSSLKYAYRYIVKYEPKLHEVQRNLSLIGEEAENINWSTLPEIIFNEQEKNNVTNILSANIVNASFIAIAPGSVWETKRYPKEQYVEIIKNLINRDETVILIGGGDDRAICEDIADNFNENVKNFAGELSVIETIYLLKNSKLLITNDSAPTHMGMCADIPVITIFCSTVSEIGFYPFNKKSSCLSFDSLDCKPCGIHGYKKCPLKSFDCGKKLLPDEVLAEAYKIINNNE